MSHTFTIPDAGVKIEQSPNLLPKTFNDRYGLTIHYNSDGSGPATLVGYDPETHKNVFFTVSCATLIEFVGRLHLSAEIARLEAMTGTEFLASR